MAYFLEALLFRGAKPVIPAPAARFVALPQKLWLVPVTDELLAQASLFAKPAKLAGTRTKTLPPEIEAWAQKYSLKAPVAFVEAEFFGGQGGQCVVVWADGAGLGPLCASDAINHALRALGIKRVNGDDEFDSVELGRHRHTHEWK